MTDEASGREAGAPGQANRTAVLVAVGIGVLVVIAAIVYFATSGSTSKTQKQITADVKAQFQTQAVSCRSIGFKAPKLTRSPIYACDIKGIPREQRPLGHLNDADFTRCYIRSGSDQTVDISHALSIEAKDQKKTVPCS